MSSTMILASPARRSLLPLIVTNSVTVGSLYLIQALARPIASGGGRSMTEGLMPGAALAGYAIGVGLSAVIARDLTTGRGLALHLLLLMSSLVLAATAWSPAVAVVACLLVGVGCSLTQRLLAMAALAVSDGERPKAIAGVIAAGLCGIVVARAIVPMLAGFGRQTILLAAATLIGACLLATSSRASLHGTASLAPSGAPTDRALSLWRRLRELRSAALQQAVVFAAYNAGWAIFPRMVASSTAGHATLAIGTVATLGAGAALLAGKLCTRRAPADVAVNGVAAVLVAGALALVAGRVPHGWEVSMAVLDMGTQTALVANQARAQACATSPAERGRIAAMVTMVGFLGGAAGSIAANLWA